MAELSGNLGAVYGSNQTLAAINDATTWRLRNATSEASQDRKYSYVGHSTADLKLEAAVVPSAAGTWSAYTTDGSEEPDLSMHEYSGFGLDGSYGLQLDAETDFTSTESWGFQYIFDIDEDWTSYGSLSFFIYCDFTSLSGGNYAYVDLVDNSDGELNFRTYMALATELETRVHFSAPLTTSPNLDDFDWENVKKIRIYVKADEAAPTDNLMIDHIKRIPKALKHDLRIQKTLDSAVCEDYTVYPDGYVEFATAISNATYYDASGSYLTSVSEQVGFHNWSVDQEASILEVTSFQNTWREYVSDIKNWAGSATQHYQSGEEGLIAGSTYRYAVYLYLQTNRFPGEDRPVSKSDYTFDALVGWIEVTRKSPAVTVGEVIDQAFDFQGCGPIRWVTENPNDCGEIIIE